MNASPRMRIELEMPGGGAIGPAEIPDALMAAVRAAQLSGRFCPERAIVSAIRAERRRCLAAVEAWRARLAPGLEAPPGIERLLADIGAYA